MSEEGKIASRIFSKHLVIHDEFNDEEKDISELGNLSEEFTHAATLGGNPEEIKLEGANDFIGGDEKMLNGNKDQTEDEIIANSETSEDEKGQQELNDLSFDDEGETLVLNFQAPSAPAIENNEPESIEIPEFEDFQKAEEFPAEISLFQDMQTESFESPSALEVVSSQIEQPNDLEAENAQTNQPDDFEVENVQTNQPDDFEVGSFQTWEQKDENVQLPKFEFVDNFDNDMNDEDDNAVQEEPIDEAAIIDDSQGRIIEEEEIEKPQVAEIKSLEKDLSDEEKEINSITAEFPILQDMNLELRSFLLNNIDILTKDRLAICIDLGVTIEELKDFFAGGLNGADRENVYTKLRKAEMQYVFENFIQCFNIESFTRKKETIDGNIIRNVVVLKEDIFIDGYESMNTARDIDVRPGENAFILSDELEINVENYIAEIKTAKLNAENSYLMILDGAIVDDDAVKLAARYGIKIVDMDTSISSVNKNLEEIKKGIIV